LQRPVFAKKPLEGPTIRPTKAPLLSSCGDDCRAVEFVRNPSSSICQRQEHRELVLRLRRSRRSNASDLSLSGSCYPLMSKSYVSQDLAVTVGRAKHDQKRHCWSRKYLQVSDGIPALAVRDLRVLELYAIHECFWGPGRFRIQVRQSRALGTASGRSPAAPSKAQASLYLRFALSTRKGDRP
jgi:hypothetical protein